MQKWDYEWAGSYFITICTYRRTCCFGLVKSGVMHLSEKGFIAQKFWMEIPEHFPTVELSDFVIMPNHVHGILTLTAEKPVDARHAVEARHALPLQQTPGQKRFQNQGRNTVSSITGGYKSAVTRNIHLMGLEFRWQDRFWDHVIRDKNEFERIRKYIIENPVKWREDDFFIQG